MNIKHIFLLVISLLLYDILAVASNAHEFVLEQLVVHHPIIRIIEKSGNKAEGYVEILNNGSKSEKLIGATLEGAKKSELFQTLENNKSHHVNAIKDGIEIGPGKTLRLGPKKEYISFYDISKKYDEDTYISGSLIFANKEPMKIEFLVAPTKITMPKNTQR